MRSVLSPEELPEYLRGFADRVDPAGRAAANGMSSAFDRGLKTNELIRTTGHPSAPGQPPALETGRLRGTLRIKPAVEAGPYRWKSGNHPDTVYAHIQEYGGEIWAKHTYVDHRTGITRPGFLRWGSPGDYHYARHVRLPERSYMRAGVKRMAGDGTLRRGAVAGFNHVLGFD